MADPFTLSALAIGSLAVGTGASILGTVNNVNAQNTRAEGYTAMGESEYRRAQYQAGVAETNKKIALQNADYTRRAGEVEALQYGRKGAQTVATQRVGKAAGNLEIDSGSSADLQDSQRMVNREEQHQVRANYARQAYGYEVEALNKGSDAELYRMSGDNARLAARYNVAGTRYAAAGSILGGVESVSSRWSSAASGGMFSGGSSTSSGAHSLGGSLAFGA